MEPTRELIPISILNAEDHISGVKTFLSRYDGLDAISVRTKYGMKFPAIGVIKKLINRAAAIIAIIGFCVFKYLTPSPISATAMRRLSFSSFCLCS